MKLLIDGDVLCYRAGFATEKTKYLVTHAGDTGAFFDDAKAAKQEAEHYADALIWSRKDVQPVDQALLITDVMIGDIRARYADSNPSVNVYLTGVGNFRNSVATRASYKGNRGGVLPPVHLKAIRNHLIDKGAIVSAGEEADDLMAIAATAHPGSVICTIDKDLMQVPGRHYNFVTKEEVTVSPKEASLNFYSQVLSGDAVDNVLGLPGIGPVKARKALADCKSPAECWAKCLGMYNAEFGLQGEPYALEAARLVYVRRLVGEMWSPPVETKAAAPQREEKASSSRRIPVGARSGNSEGLEGARN